MTWIWSLDGNRYKSTILCRNNSLKVEGIYNPQFEDDLTTEDKIINDEQMELMEIFVEYLDETEIRIPEFLYFYGGTYKKDGRTGIWIEWEENYKKRTPVLVRETFEELLYRGFKRDKDFPLEFRFTSFNFKSKEVENMEIQ